MQPPLTGARKTMLVRATNDNTSQKKNLVDRKCSNSTFTTKLNNSRLKLEILAANTIPVFDTSKVVLFALTLIVLGFGFDAFVIFRF